MDGAGDAEVPGAGTLGGAPAGRLDGPGTRATGGVPPTRRGPAPGGTAPPPGARVPARSPVACPGAAATMAPRGSRTLPRASRSSSSAAAVPPMSAPSGPSMPVPPAATITAAVATSIAAAASSFAPASRASPARGRLPPATGHIVGAVLRGVRNRWRRSFVGSVTLIALLVVALFAAVTGRIVHEQIEDQAFERAAETAEVLARVSFTPRLPAPGGRLPARDVRALDRQLRAAGRGGTGLDATLVRRDGTVLYTRDRGRIGTTARSGPIAAALAGRTRSELDESGDDPVLVTAAPVVRRAGGAVAGALEVRLPYRETADDVAARTRRLVIALAVIALLAYLLALPALLRASRALKAQYDPRRVELVRELRRAIDHGELTLHFQPIVHAATREPAAAEALVRWNHPRRGAVPPDHFIPMAEPTDVMWPLTLHVLDLAIGECATWRRLGHEVSVAVNVSGGVLHDRRLHGEIEGLLARHGLPVAALEIEVTEGAVMRDPEAASKILRGLTELGIRVIAIDDFGTGYSSLARLHELPLDTLKIDQSFVTRMAAEGDAQIVCSIVELAHALGMKVIAEGAEDDATITRLAALGCDFVQGYGLTRPLPPDAFRAWLEEPAAARA